MKYKYKYSLYNKMRERIKKNQTEMENIEMYTRQINTNTREMRQLKYVMKKADKPGFSDIIFNAIAVLSCLFLVWVVASWFDVITNNLGSCEYAWWNAFEILAKFYHR